MEKVDRRGKDDCWPFLSSIGRTGCGRFYYRGKCHDAYRIGYTLLVGPIPDGKHLHHTCENRICVNPAHLIPVTRREHYVEFSPNHIAYTNARKTHCPAGHLLAGNNLVSWLLNSSGARSCLTCARRRIRECQARRRAKTRKNNGLS